MPVTKSRTILTFIVIILPTFLYSLFRFSTGVLLPSLEKVYSFPDALGGVVLSASVGSATLGVAASGYFVEKLGESRTVLVGLLLFSIPMGVIAVAGNLSFFTALFMLSAVGSGLMTTPTYSIAVSLLPKRRGAAISLITAGYNVGGLAGPVIAGYLLAYHSWQYPFIAMCAIGLLFMAAFRAGLGYSHLNIQRSKAKRKAGLKGLLGNRNLLAVAMSMFCADFAYLAFASWTPKFLISSFGVIGNSVALIDLYFGISIGLGGIGIMVAGPLIDRIGGRRTALLSAVAAVLTNLGLYVSHSIVVAVGFMFAAGLVSNWFWVLLTAMAQANVPDEQHPIATSFAQTVGFMGAFLGPGIAGLVGVGGSVTSLSLVATVVIPNLIYAVIVLLIYRDPNRFSRTVGVQEGP